ncbi:MAG TPA: type I-E CRISPR-associated protein Cse1/CasA, partial [Deltaproteobacteria bacterium]|nr:type I-E CRISPR-associated protein Cse1/CasA [Deltaproteobacteria bacterium]
MNLLTDPLIHASTPDGVEACTLPGVLHQLTLRRISSFGALQGWQEHSWFAFLVQLAALALQRAGQAEPPSSEEGWRALLLALTAGDAGPWALIVDDLGAPAFLQPP